MGLLDRAGAGLPPVPKTPKFSSSTLAPSSTPPSRNRFDHPRDGSAQDRRPRQANSSSPAAWSSAIATKSGRTFLKSMPWSAPASSKRFSKLQAWRPLPRQRRFAVQRSSPARTRKSGRAKSPVPARTNRGNLRPQSRPEGDARERSRPLPSRRRGRAHRIFCPLISTTKTPRASCPRRARRLTSKSPRAATIPAPSASFPTCAASSARAVSNRSSLKPSNWSPEAFARSRSSARTPPATAKTSA